MLGYTEQDINEMRLALNLAVKNPNLSERITDGLMKANSLLTGLLSEGYIESEDQD